MFEDEILQTKCSHLQHGLQDDDKHATIRVRGGVFRVKRRKRVKESQVLEERVGNVTRRSRGDKNKGGNPDMIRSRTLEKTLGALYCTNLITFASFYCQHDQIWIVSRKVTRKGQGGHEKKKRRVARVHDMKSQGNLIVWLRASYESSRYGQRNRYFPMIRPPCMLV